MKTNVERTFVSVRFHYKKKQTWSGFLFQQDSTIKKNKRGADFCFRKIPL